ncbi:MAG: acyl-CoA thioesterase domain-containing protein [Mycobacterium sp.]
MTSTLREVLATLELDRVNQTFFVGTQLDGPAHHILGGHISAQALVATARTVEADRGPRIMHAQFLRSGDARQPVDFEVVTLHDGGTFSTRRATARQFGAVLMEATVSFSKSVDSEDYQPPMPVVPAPESLESVPVRGIWTSLEWFERRNVPADASEVARLWWRPDGQTPADPVINAALVAYLSAVTLVEAALAARPAATDYRLSSMLDHSVWFHQPADVSDWLLYEQLSASGAHRRALTTGRMFSRAGTQVCTATQELYFPRPRER